MNKEKLWYKKILENFFKVANSALFVAILVFLLQIKHETQTSNMNDKISLYSKILKDSACYLTYNSKLNEMAMQEWKTSNYQKQIDRFFSTKNDYLNNKNGCYIDLTADFEDANYKFNHDTKVLINNFMRFYNDNKSKEINILPPNSEYQKRLNAIIASIQTQLPKSK